VHNRADCVGRKRPPGMHSAFRCLQIGSSNAVRRLTVEAPLATVASGGGDAKVHPQRLRDRISGGDRRGSPLDPGESKTPHSPGH
jgi:hypothetical protein